MSSAVFSAKIATGITEHTGELIKVSSTLLPPSRAAGPTSSTRSGAAAITVSATVSAVVVSTYTRCLASAARSAGSKALSAPTSKIVGSSAGAAGIERRGIGTGRALGRTGFFGGAGRTAKAAAGRADERSFILGYHPPAVSGGPVRSLSSRVRLARSFEGSVYAISWEMPAWIRPLDASTWPTDKSGG